MIDVLQGALGSGKSAAATAKALYHLKRGGVVAANFSLVDGWAEIVASHLLLSKIPIIGESYKRKKAASLYKRFFRVDCLDAVEQLNPRDHSVDLYEYKGGYSEGEGLLILDECHLMFNTRRWSDESNNDWVRFFSQSRKKGWNVLLISHSIESIDKQIRPLCEYETRFRNLQKVYLPFIGLPLSPIPLFLHVTRYAGLGAGAGSVAFKGLYPLPYFAANLYDSLEVFGERSDINRLPTLCGKEPTSPREGGSPVRVSSLSPDCLWSRWELENPI